MQNHIRVIIFRLPPQGYFPDPTKIILLVSPQNVQIFEAHLRGMGVPVVTGRSYLSGFIGDHKLDTEWMAENVDGWIH